MSLQTVTRVAESDLEPSEIYEVLAEASNIPRWAPVFADHIEPIDDTHYSVTKGGSTFKLEVISHRAAGTVDYVREMANNRRSGAYIRVTPRPLGGSSVTITVSLAANSNQLEAGTTVEQELAELIRIARAQSSKL